MRYSGFRWVFRYFFIVSLCVGMLPFAARAEPLPRTIRIDWATYNLVSILLKQKGMLEKEFGKDGISIQWSQSSGAPVPVKGIKEGTLDIGSMAGASAVQGRLAGSPLKAVYVFAKPEWTALVVLKDSPIHAVEDLKGKRVAVTVGTDPYAFLLRALGKHGLTERDIVVVNMPHPDGRIALEKGEVDAWGGLDPMMGQMELEKGSRLFFRDANMNTYGVLCVSEDFLRQYPQTVMRVLSVYEEGRKYAKAHIGEMRKLLADTAKLSEVVAAKQLERTNLDDPVLGVTQQRVLVAAGIALKLAGRFPEDTDVSQEVAKLLDTRFSAEVAKIARTSKPAKPVKTAKAG